MPQSEDVHRPPLRPASESQVAVSIAAYTAKADDHLIGVNGTGAVTATLPTAQLKAGRSRTVENESGAGTQPQPRVLWFLVLAA